MRGAPSTTNEPDDARRSRDPVEAPLISIVTPSYNQRDFIEDNLVSVAKQDYRAVEHIVIDGESDDGTIEVLDEYDDRHDHLEWVSEPDDGQADAINKGFDMASGDIIGWLNSDDVYFDPGVLSRVAERIERTRADIIYGDIALIDQDSKVLKLHLTPRFEYGKLLRYCFIDQPALFLDADVLNGERLDSDLEYAMDYEFWLRIARDYEFRHVADVLAGDRNHPARKILNERKRMRTEARNVAKRYGAATGWQYRVGRGTDVVSSGVPRRLKATIQTIQLHRNLPQLAFDGQLCPLNKMLRNVFKPNRTLV